MSGVGSWLAAPTLWRTARPRKPLLSRDLIVETAGALVDAEGLEAVSTRRLAAALGVSGPSLYNQMPAAVRPASQPWRLFLMTGVLGGYTTFSSFEYEIFQAVRSGERWIGLLYGVGSVVCGYFAVWLGTLLAARR